MNIPLSKVEEEMLKILRLKDKRYDVDFHKRFKKN